MFWAGRACGYPWWFSKRIGGPPARHFWMAASPRGGPVSTPERSSAPASLKYSSVERRLEMSFLLIVGMGLAIVVLLGGSGGGDGRGRPPVLRWQESPQTVLNFGDVFKHHAGGLSMIAAGEGRTDALMKGQIAAIGGRVHLEARPDFFDPHGRHRVGEEHQERILGGFREHPVEAEIGGGVQITRGDRVRVLGDVGLDAGQLPLREPLGRQARAPRVEGHTGLG